MIKYGKNPLYSPERIFFIGDIHGMDSCLKNLLVKILPLETNDHIVFCGDLINKGDNSALVLETINELIKKYPNQIFIIKGNHDWMLHSYLIHNNQGWFSFLNKTLENFKEEWQLIDTKADTIKNVLIEKGIWSWFYEKSITYYETEKVIATHAPLNYMTLICHGGNEYERDFLEEGEELFFRHLLDRVPDLMWEFTNEEDKRIDNIVKKFKVCGHQFKHHKQPRIFRNRAFIDTGCGTVPNKPLIALEFPSKRILKSE